jgi:cell division protein YceG involved in septum cleavage
MKAIRFLIIIIVIFLLLAGMWYSRETSPVDKSTLTKQQFVVDKGMGVKAIGAKLQEAHLIKSAFAFYLTVKVTFNFLPQTRQKLSHRILPREHSMCG